jgi:hypothetical protein
MNVYQENYATYVGKKPKWLVAPRRALFCVNTVLCLCCLGLMWLGLRCLGRLLSWAIAVLGDCCLGRLLSWAICARPGHGSFHGDHPSGTVCPVSQRSCDPRPTLPVSNR